MSMIGNYLRVPESELQEYLADSNKLEDRISDYDPEDTSLIDIDKAWNGIFYLLTGKTLEQLGQAEPPLKWVSFPKNEIDPDLDMGYGPALYSTPAETKQVNAALSALTEEQFKSRFDGKRMTELEVYPIVWDEPDSIDYLVDYFNNLKAFYKTAAENNEAMIVFIS